MHDVIVVGIPLFAILSGIFFNRNDIKELRGEMYARFDQMDARFNRMDARFDKMEKQIDGINADLRQFYHLTGKLESDVENLKKRL